MRIDWLLQHVKAPLDVPLELVRETGAGAAADARERVPLGVAMPLRTAVRADAADVNFPQAACNQRCS
jgi:hypothetical protein